MNRRRSVSGQTGAGLRGGMELRCRALGGKPTGECWREVGSPRSHDALVNIGWMQFFQMRLTNL